MNRVAIVILNYLNYEDTIECIDSILCMQYSICGIVIVDNYSTNNSYEILKAKYNGIDMIKVISSGSNLGYAKGNNIGIAYARKYFHAEFVLVANNDTIFNDKSYVEGLLKEYHPGVGVLGGKIILNDGREQHGLTDYRGFRATALRYLNMLSLQCGSSFDFVIDRTKPIVVLHGCALMFTPDFFKKYKGFYKRTFLYREEVILYYMCQCAGLQQVYIPNVSIYHKEGGASFMSFQKEKSYISKYVFHGEKYAIWWEFKYYIMRRLNITGKKTG